MNEKPIGAKEPPQPITPLPPILPCTQNVAYLRTVHSVLLAVGVAVGTAWGLKLEYRMDQARAASDRQTDRVAELERAVGHGILPLTEERITRLGVRLEQIADDHGMMRDRIEAVAAAVERVSLLQTECALATERRRSRTAR